MVQGGSPDHRGAFPELSGISDPNLDHGEVNSAETVSRNTSAPLLVTPRSADRNRARCDLPPTGDDLSPQGNRSEEGNTFHSSHETKTHDSPDRSPELNPTKLRTEDCPLIGPDKDASTPTDEHQGLNMSDLSPSSFSSLEEAFRASLYVVRCLRRALSLMQDAQRQGFPVLGNDDGAHASTTPSGDAICRVSQFLASQESFVADDTAYAVLLRCKGIKALSPIDGAANRTGPAAAKDQHSSADSTKSRRLEYELSVCKALLLLQRLTPNSNATDEGLSPSPPPPAPAVHLDQSTKHQFNDRAELVHSTTPFEFERVQHAVHRNTASSAALLDALLRVRLLQGTQQLLRADFLRLLYHHRKQHQRLQQAVQTTVMRLGPANTPLCLAALQHTLKIDGDDT